MSFAVSVDDTERDFLQKYATRSARGMQPAGSPGLPAVPVQPQNGVPRNVP